MRRNFAILFALTLAVPVAAANWNYRGTNEPDTIYDDATYMFEGTDTSPNPSVHKIYFNMVQHATSVVGYYNPGVSALGTRVQPVETFFDAMLGYWKDCNNDGYVGNAEQTLLEYPSQLLLDTSICAPTAPTTTQSIYPHNDGDWVREIIWIGPQKGAAGAATGNPTNFYADDTMVWSDWGLAGGRPTLVCPGANTGVRSTGALLDGIDCSTYYRIGKALNDVDTASGGAAGTGGWDTSDEDNSNAPLNVQNPAYPFLYGPAEPEGDPEEGDFRGYNGGIFGRDRSTDEQRERMVTIVDCDTNSPDTSPTVGAMPSDPMDTGNYPSLYESLNDTFEVATQSGDDRCSPQNSADEGLKYPNVEGYTEPTFAEAGRDVVDFSYEFNPGNRNPQNPALGVCTAKVDGSPRQFTRGPLGYCPPADLGLAPERDLNAVGPAWRTNAIVGTYPTTVREGLQGSQPDMGAFYMTAYARLGGKALGFGARPSAVESVYGSPACGSFTSGIHNFWNCDSAAWFARCADPELDRPANLCQTVGMSYHLKDTDCWDGTLVRGAGIRASLADVSPSGPCAGNPSNENIDIPG